MDSVKQDFPAGVALVVGGSGGVGAAACRSLVSAGADVVLTYCKGREKGERIAHELSNMGAKVDATRLDLRDRNDTFLERITEEYGSIHTLVMASGSDIRMKWIGEVSDEEWCEVMRVDADGAARMIRSAIPFLRASAGSMVVVGSVGLARFPARDILSVAPKAILDVLVKGIAREEGRYGVRANTVALGVIETGIFDRLRGVDFPESWVDAAVSNTALKRFGRPEEVGDVIAFLASSRASYLTGQTLYLDGGYQI